MKKGFGPEGPMEVSVLVLEIDELLGLARVDDLEAVSDDGGHYQDDGTQGECAGHGIGEDEPDLFIERSAEVLQPDLSFLH